MIGKAILNFLTGGLVDKVFTFLADRERAKIAAMNDTERRAFEERESVRTNMQEVRLATAGFWEMRLLTFLIAAPFAFHLISIWADTQFKLDWAVDKFPAPFDEWEGVILLSFFGASAVGNGIKAVAGAMALTRTTRRN